MTSVTPTSNCNCSPSAQASNNVVVALRSTVVPGEPNSSLDCQQQIRLCDISSYRERGFSAYSYPHLVPREDSSSPTSLVNYSCSDMHASAGFEPERISCVENDSFRETNDGASSSGCLKWAESLQTLLNDAEGLNLFQQFLQQEDPDRFHMLEFWLACKGLSKQPPERVHQLVRVIYAQLFLKAQLGIDENLRKSIAQQIKNDTNNKKPLSPNIFNEACAVVERAMNEVMHPNFLTSDVYLNYVQRTQTSANTCAANLNVDCDPPESPREAPACAEEADNNDDSVSSMNRQPLPVVDEDKELTDCPSFRCRVVGKRASDSYPIKFSRQINSSSRSNAFRRLYNYSYNPVSRQDSELQSLSSDARTDSMSDLSVDDSASHGKESYVYKRQLQRQSRMMKENALMNKNSDLAYHLVPRTSNRHARESAKPLLPQEFAKILIFKLEKLKKERETDEIMVHKLNAMENVQSETASCSMSSHQALHEHEHEHIVGGQQRNDDDSQEILDNHMARIWSDKTPRRSPGQATPVRPRSPDGRKVWSAQLSINKATCHSNAANSTRPVHCNAGGNGSGTYGVVTVGSSTSGGVSNMKRKDKDLCSLFSSDSGNGTDAAESFDHHYRNLSKSKLMPDQNETHASADFFSGCSQRSVSRSGCSSRKTYTDSGVSMVSGGSHVKNSISTSSQYKDKLVSSWLLDSNRICGDGGGGSGSGVGGSGTTCSTINEERDTSTCTLLSTKHKSKSNAPCNAYSLTRSKISGAGMSMDRSLVCVGNNAKNVLPGQPFVADPSMPPFPFHSVDTDTQLEETRRRLNEIGPKLNRLPTAMAIVGVSKTCENTSSCIKMETTPHPHRAATLTRSSRKTYAEDSGFTTVVYNFSDEQMPYLSRIPGSPITLKQFKDYMPKKGRYRYYFVTSCEDLEMQPIQEEMTDDNELVPLWKGKVIAQIRAVD